MDGKQKRFNKYANKYELLNLISLFVMFFLCVWEIFIIIGCYSDIMGGFVLHVIQIEYDSRSE